MSNSKIPHLTKKEKSFPAAKNSDLSAIIKKINNGEKLNFHEILKASSENEQLETVRYLLLNHRKPQLSLNVALKQSIKNGHLEISWLLMSAGAIPGILKPEQTPRKKEQFRSTPISLENEISYRQDIINSKNNNNFSDKNLVNIVHKNIQANQEIHPNTIKLLIAKAISLNEEDKSIDVNAILDSVIHKEAIFGRGNDNETIINFVKQEKNSILNMAQKRLDYYPDIQFAKTLNPQTRFSIVETIKFCRKIFPNDMTRILVKRAFFQEYEGKNADLWASRMVRESHQLKQIESNDDIMNSPSKVIKLLEQEREREQRLKREQEESQKSSAYNSQKLYSINKNSSEASSSRHF